MLGRTVAAVAIVAGITSAALAQDVALPDIDFGRYHALVIGNNDYQHLRKLNTAVGDAEAVAKLLEDKYGFAVTTLTNATRREIVTALNDLRRSLTENDNLLIYYAGHGVLDAETATGFWLPTDAEKDNDVNWIANDYMSRTLRAMTANHVMVVADSCYSGTLIRATPTSLKSGAERVEWLARMTRKRSRTAMVSGGLEPVLDSGGGGHSVFAKAFLAALEENDGILEGQELFARVSRPVVVNSDQTPDYSDIRRAGHDGGEFMFVPLDINVNVTVQIPPTGQADREALFWQSIQDSDDPAMFEAYLDQFPEGVFARIARLRVEANAKQQQTTLAKAQKDARAQAEAEAQRRYESELKKLRQEITAAALAKEQDNKRIQESARRKYEAELERLKVEATAARSKAQKKARLQAEAEAKRRYEAELSKLQQERKKEAEAKRRYEAELSKLQQERKKVSAAELAFWDTIKDTKDPEDYQAYLEAYPKGGFVALARVRSGHPFDGQWKGSMRCGSCANCLGPLEKPVSISIKNSKFDIIPDATYLGTGKIDDEGNLKIDRSRNSPDYVNVKKSRRNFRFSGKYEGESFVLHGKRGPRSCEITLSRVSPM